MRKVKVVFGVVAALGLMAFSASMANAQGIGGPFAGSWGAQSPDFTGSGHGTHVFRVGNAVTVSCSVTNRGDVNPSPAPVDAHGHPRTATVNMNYTPCTATIFGFPAAAATVTDNCTWSFTVSTYTMATSAGTGTITTNCNTIISVPSLGCTITVPNQTVNVSTQNVNSADLATSTGPAGVHIIANDNTISGTSSGCFGVPTNFTNAVYQGTKHENGVWVNT